MAERLTNVFGEFATSDYALALLLATDNYALVRCTTGTTTEYTYKIEDEDIKIYLQDVLTNPATSVNFLKVLNAKKFLDDVVRRAKNNFGIWTNSQGWTTSRQGAA